jgi:hypothetical protein
MLGVKKAVTAVVPTMAWHDFLGPPTRWALRRGGFYAPASQRLFDEAATTAESVTKITGLSEYQRFVSAGRDRSAQKVSVGRAIKSLYGYVPITGQATYLYIFNFLGVNYATRGPALLRFTVLKNDEVIRQFTRIIEPDNVMCVGGDNVSFFGVDEGHVVGELFHPHLRPLPMQNHFRFIVMYRDESLGAMATVHGNRVPALMPLRGSESGRNYIPLSVLDRDIVMSHGSPHRVVPIEELVRNVEGNYARPAQHFEVGFNFLKKVDGVRSSVLSAWHDSQLHRIVAFDESGSDGYQAIFIPYFEHCAPFLQFSSDQLGVERPEITVSLYPLGSPERYAASTFTLTSSAQFLSLKALFDGFSGHAVCHVTIHKAISKQQGKPILYVHAFFDSALGIADNVHTAETKFSPQRASLPTLGNSEPLPTRRCRKWGLHLVEDHIESWLSIVIAAHHDPERIPPLKVRLFSDTGVEGLCYLELPNLPVFAVPARKLLSDAGIQCERFFYAQIEHSHYNYDANFYNIDLRTHAVAVDHYTGG